MMGSNPVQEPEFFPVAFSTAYQVDTEHLTCISRIKNFTHAIRSPHNIRFSYIHIQCADLINCLTFVQSKRSTVPHELVLLS